MAVQKITTYSVGFEGNPKHDALLALGSWGDESHAHEALRTVMGWEEIYLSPIFQCTYEVAAFAAFPSAAARDAATPPYAGAPRVMQHNAIVVPPGAAEQTTDVVASATQHGKKG